MYLQTSRSSCKLEIYRYNLQKVGVFQTAHSDKIFKPRLVNRLYHKKAEISIAEARKIIENFRKVCYNETEQAKNEGE